MPLTVNSAHSNILLGTATPRCLFSCEFSVSFQPRLMYLFLAWLFCASACTLLMTVCHAMLYRGLHNGGQGMLNAQCQMLRGYCCGHKECGANNGTITYECSGDVVHAEPSAKSAAKAAAKVAAKPGSQVCSPACS